MMWRHSVIALLLLLPLTTAAASGHGRIVPPSADALLRDVTRLADPSFEGRAAGTAAGARAADDIARALAAAGLQPGGDATTFFQSFVIATGTRIAPQSSVELVSPAAVRLDGDRDWRPHGGSLREEVTNDVVFVGYGITTADGRWDDYRDVDVRGRIALALDGAPAGVAPSNRLDKLIAARRAGAGALLIASEQLPTLDDTSARVGIVSASVTRAAADRMLAPGGHTVGKLEAAIGARRAPASFAIAGRRARVRVALTSEDRRAVNVVGILPGRDPALAHEAIVVGGHYDHIGIAGRQIHPGADDNASGTAVVLGLARAFAAAGGAPRTLVFALFGAEEIGLVGSAHYVTQPAIPLARTVAMVNLDMVGRLRDKPLHVGGVDSGNGLRGIVQEAAAATGVRVDLRPDPHSPSDQVSFYRAGTPVLFLHTGTHADYHRPTDTADRIDADGLARVATLTAAIVDRLATATPPTYVKLTPSPARRERAVGAASASTAFLGVAADGHGRGDGVRLREVIPGSAAERAGLRPGDVLVRIGGELVNGFDDVRRLIEAKQPGDAVALLFLRDGEDRTASTTLGARP